MALTRWWMVVGREEERELELIFVGFERDNVGFWVCPVSCEREGETRAG